MATTRLISMHQNSGKTIAACLTARTAYAHYQKAKKLQKEVLTAKANVDVVLGTGFGQSGRREVRGER